MKCREELCVFEGTRLLPSEPELACTTRVIYICVDTMRDVLYQRVVFGSTSLGYSLVQNISKAQL